MDDDDPGDLVAAVLILKHLAELLPICEGMRVIVFPASCSARSGKRAMVQAMVTSHACSVDKLCAS